MIKSHYVMAAALGVALLAFTLRCVSFSGQPLADALGRGGVGRWYIRLDVGPDKRLAVVFHNGVMRVVYGGPENAAAFVGVRSHLVAGVGLEHYWGASRFSSKPRMSIRSFRVPLSYVATFILLGTGAAFFHGPARRCARWRKGFCVQCAYDLTGLHSRRCPECGTLFESPQTTARLDCRRAIARLTLGMAIGVVSPFLITFLQSSFGNDLIQGMCCGASVVVFPVRETYAAWSFGSLLLANTVACGIILSLSHWIICVLRIDRKLRPVGGPDNVEDQSSPPAAR